MIHEAIKDIETYEIFLGNTLRSGDCVYINDEPNIEFKFHQFETAYYGRLGNPGCPPGKYWNISKCIIKKEENGGIRSRIVETKNLIMPEIFLKEKLTEKALLHDFNQLFIEHLPATTFFESDVVKLVDKNHSKYVSNTALNQFTIFRIEYEKLPRSESYILRKAGKFFRAALNQLELAGDALVPAYGPVRLYEEGQKLKWKSLQAEAEFNILIGKFKKLLNPFTLTYTWDLDTAMGALKKGTGHALLKQKKDFYLIELSDADLANNIVEAQFILDVGTDTKWDIED